MSGHQENLNAHWLSLHTLCHKVWLTEGRATPCDTTDQYTGPVSYLACYQVQNFLHLPNPNCNNKDHALVHKLRLVSKKNVMSSVCKYLSVKRNGKITNWWMNCHPTFVIKYVVQIKKKRFILKNHNIHSLSHQIMCCYIVFCVKKEQIGKPVSHFHFNVNILSSFSDKGLYILTCYC